MDRTATGASLPDAGASGAKAPVDTSLRALLPFIQRSALVVVLEPDGQMGAVVFRPGAAGDTIERVGHSVDVAYGHAPHRYVKRLTLKLDAPLEDEPDV